MPEFISNSDTTLPADVVLPDDFPWSRAEVVSFFDGYVQTMLWVNVSWETDSGEAPDGYDNALIELTQDQLRELAGDVIDFMGANEQDLRQLQTIFRPSLRIDALNEFGYNFALTRNGHGAGFWDRGWGDLGDALTKACKPYGPANIDAWIENGEIVTSIQT